MDPIKKPKYTPRNISFLFQLVQSAVAGALIRQVIFSTFYDDGGGKKSRGSTEIAKQIVCKY